MNAGAATISWYPKVLTHVVAIKTVLVEISDGHRFTTTSVNPQNYTKTVPTDASVDVPGTIEFVDGTTRVFDKLLYQLSEPVTLLVLQPAQGIMLMQKLSLVHGLP